MTARKLTSIIHSGLPAILGSVLIWGTMPFVVQFTSLEIPPGQLTTIRLLLAGFLISLNLGKKRVYQAIRRNVMLFIILGAVGFTIPHLFYIYALKSVPIPILTFISNSYPALAILMAAIFLKEKPSIQHILGIGSALIGLYLLAGAVSDLGKGAIGGVIFALLASLGWATSAIAGKKITTRLSTIEIVAGRHLVGGFFAIPLIFFEGYTLTQASGYTWLGVLILAGMSVASFYLYYRGLSKVSVATASVLESFTPVITLGISSILFGESLQGIRLMGAFLILSGTVLVSLHDMHRTSKVTPVPFSN